MENNNIGNLIENQYHGLKQNNFEGYTKLNVSNTSLKENMNSSNNSERNNRSNNTNNDSQSAIFV